MNPVTATFTRPADTNVYASGDLVSNNTVAGSVVPLSFPVGKPVFPIRRVKIKKSGTVVTSAQFRLHLYTSSPTSANGDNGVWSTTESGYLGFVDVTIDKAFSDGAAGHGAPSLGQEINANVNGIAQTGAFTIYGLLEARAAYTPTSGEIFTVSLEIQATPVGY